MSYRYKVTVTDEGGKQSVLERTNSLELAQSFKESLIENDKAMRRLRPHTSIPVLKFEILDSGQQETLE